MWKEFIKEYKEYSEKREEEVLAYLIDALLGLWFEPHEPLDDFRKWFWKRITKYKITWSQLEHVIDNYYDYWSECDKKIKNYKTSFFNNPLLRRFLLEEYETPYYNINDL
mgnify:CR=1 FL=1